MWRERRAVTSISGHQAPQIINAIALNETTAASAAVKSS